MTWIWLLKTLLAAKIGIATTFWANGDPGNPNPLNYCTNRPLKDKAMVVAHKSLPCGTKIVILAPRTGKAVVATVLDRGPRRAALDTSLGVTKALKLNGKELVLFFPINIR